MNSDLIVRTFETPAKALEYAGTLGWEAGAYRGADGLAGRWIDSGGYAVVLHRREDEAGAFYVWMRL